MYGVTYVLDGTKILSQTYLHSISKQTYTVKFFYDENDAPIAMEYDGNYYYYRTNIQGDIEGIYNSNGTLVVSYSYDAWGNILSTTGTLADTVGETNPFRYRGYYYDTETGLYYVSSRYYDPEIGRFLNADEATYLGASGTILGYNLFAYCENNPVNYEDPTGNWLIQVICGVAGAAVFGTVANIVCRLLGVNATIRRLITAGFALIGGVLGAAFGSALVGRIAPKALTWVNNLEKIINRKSRLRPMLFEGHVAIGWEWDRRFKIMLHFKHENEPEKGMHITIQHFTGRNWRRTIPDIPIKSLGKVFINWVKKFLK